MRTTRAIVNKYLLRLKKGEDCLEEFIDYSCGYLQYIAYKYLIDKSLVDDVIFLAYDRILQAIKTFDNSKNGLAWIVKITQNEAYRLNRDDVNQIDEWVEFKNEGTGGSFNEDDALKRYDIEKAIGNLDEQERLIIEYKIFMGMTVREIANLMCIPKSNVSFIFKRALKKLEKYLE